LNVSLNRKILFLSSFSLKSGLFFTLSANDIGEIAAVAEIIVNTMVKDKLSVTINNHARNSVINADTMPNVDFSGKFYRIYSGNDALAYALKMLDTISIEANKDFWPVLK